MAEPLKDIYFTPGFVRELAGSIRTHHKSFDAEAFERSVLGGAWEELELKQRMRRVTEVLGERLPAGYPEALRILRKVAPDFEGFDAMVFPDFVECFGLDHWSLSMPALKEFTVLCSSEFAVRPFISANPDRAFEHIAEWAKDDDERVRRLASEGCRPRLPWAGALPRLKKDPSPILPILEKLKDDESEFVRRSVANNLNDISKDHPDLVLEIAGRWLGSSERTDRLVKHASRTLLKKGDPKAMRLFGFGDPMAVSVELLDVKPATVRLGGTAEFSFELTVTGTDPVRLRLEYAMDYAKSGGKRSRKIFQIREGEFEPGRHAIRRKISFEDLSTRKHYPGEHGLTIVVNGVEKESVTFDLTGR